MDVRENLVELVRNAHKKCKAKKTCHECEQYGNGSDCIYMFMADELIAHGVTVQELDGCVRCKDSQEMTVTIISKLVDGVNTGWVGGNLPARYCPFCGRRLPQPPKGE